MQSAYLQMIVSKILYVDYSKYIEEDEILDQFEAKERTTNKLSEDNDGIKSAPTRKSKVKLSLGDRFVIHRKGDLYIVDEVMARPDKKYDILIILFLIHFLIFRPDRRINKRSLQAKNFC